MRILLTMVFVAFVLMAVLIPSLAVGQDCFEPEDYLHRVGGIDTPGTGYDVVTLGHYAYLVDGIGLQVIDISNPESLRIVGSVDTPGEAVGIVLLGTHAYVADEDSGLQVIDISNPEDPQIVGGVDTPDEAVGIAIAGTYAYVADENSGLQIIDISNPVDPQIVGSYEIINHAALGVTISGSHAYVVCGEGLYTIDVSNPMNPLMVGYISFVSSGMWGASGVTISGSYAYVAAYQTYIWKYPVQIGDLKLGVIDISNPQLPQWVGSYSEYGNRILSGQVTISGTYALLGCKYGLRVIDISIPESPQLFGSMEGINAGGIVIEENRAYVADLFSGLQVVDVSNLQSPPIAGSVEIPGYARGIALSSTHAYVASGIQNEWGGLYVVDINNTESPLIVGNVPTPGDVHDVAITNTHVYVADGSSGLQVIDISNPENPLLAGSFDTPDRAQEVVIQGSYAYVADGSSGLQVIDISNPESPTLAGSLDLQLQANSIAVSETHAYVAALDLPDTASFQVIDITSPMNPQIVGSVDIRSVWSHAWDLLGIEVAGQYAYIAVVGPHNVGLGVIDISNPENPQIVGSVHLAFANSVEISGHHAYVTGQYSGLSLVDITNPENPEVVCSGAHGWAGGVALSGTHAYVVGEYGLQITPLHCADIVGITEDYFDPEPTDVPESIAHLSVHPNPFNPQATISFSIDHPQYVELSIYDMTGRLIAVLADRSFEAGVHSMDWQGKDRQGRAVASGTYLLRMSTDETVASEKMMLVR